MPIPLRADYDAVSNDIGNPSRGDAENPSTPATMSKVRIDL